ncbi:aldehyde dehydrogenase family protein [Microbaculum marinisediminis]|uniref:Aldehyde dehydrogenase family protein n=1 Tax=Microbaculum marinisediminis TaxID=2931392 RepID=A0AAW5R3Y6_9HYPH|nr:aldehyde dehydrogenase family protein [Microbaculum sp. A6E488]MCT8974643.1 aldehyde dehydrogenase family protein [Microbaculum sp. A6E488]
MKELKNLVAGEWRGSARTWDKISPFSGHVVARVHEAEKQMIDDAVAAGRAAAFGEWGTMPMRARVAIIRDFAQKLSARVDDLVEADMADTGRSRWQASTFDGKRATGLFEKYCELALTLENRSNNFEGEGGFQGVWLTQRRPKGVIACIAPWNVPLLMMSLKLAPALVMGNAAIAKPSEETPSSTTILAEVIAASEVPDGAFSLLHGFGRDSTGAWITEHPGVDAITFTGEPATGAAIMRTAATGLREVSMELGGKNPALVFEDVDMERAIEGGMRSAFFNTGQICFCTERVYVHRSRYDEYVDRMVGVADSIVMGEPERSGFSIGPLVSHSHREKVKSLVDTVVPEGGEILAGGRIPEFGDERDKGAFYCPTVAVGLDSDATMMREETFGPVMHVAPFDDEDEAIALANNSRYGLGAVIWSQNVARCLSLPPKLRVGHVWVNSWQIRDLSSPLAGVGISGVGEQFGVRSLEFCSQPQTITIRLD